MSLAKQLLAFVAFAYVGLRVLRMSDAEWEQPSHGHELVVQPQPA